MTDNAPAPRKTFTIPAENLDRLVERVAEINKRVARLAKKGYDAQPVVIEVSKAYAVKQVCSRCGGKGQVHNITCQTCGGQPLPDRVFSDVTLISPEPPKANGWEFVAALTHVEGVGAVLRVVPGAQVAEGELARYREASSLNCDHCHAERHRKDTFILRKLA